MVAVFVLASAPALALAVDRTNIPLKNWDGFAVFRDASQALRVVLWQQGRIGISQGTTGSDLPPALLSRHDRHMLKSGFPAIQRLLELASDPAWLDAL